MGPTSVRRQLWRWWGWLVLATLLLTLLCSVRYFGVVDLDATFGSLLFRASMLIAHFAALTTLLLLPVLLVALLLPRPRLVLPIGIVSSALIVVALLVDTQVYRLYRFHINGGVLNLLFGGAAGETFVFSAAMYAQALLIVAVVLVATTLTALIAWRRVRHQPGNPRLAQAAITLVIVCIVGFHGTHAWADVASKKFLLKQTDVLPLRYVVTAKRFLRSVGVDVRRESAPLASGPGSGALQYPTSPLTCVTPTQRPNIIVILIDSWRFDAMNATVTPHIATFAQRSLRFDEHYSGGNATRIGVFSLFYSIPGTYWHSILNDRKGPVVFDELLRQQYEISAFRSAPLYSPEFDRTVFASLGDVRMRSDGKGPAEWDRDLTDDFRRYLKTRDTDRPFFSLLFYDAPHSFDFPADYPLPFQPSIENINYLKLGRGSDRQPWFNRYLNSVHYVDGLVGEVLADVEARGLLKNSVILITGDHGQEFNDNDRNYWGHSSNFTRYQTGVPFILYSPSVQPGTVDHRTTHFDVMPTLMRDYLGCTDPFSTHSVGRPLLEAGGRETLLMAEYADFAIVQEDRIAVVKEHGLDVLSVDYGELAEDSLRPDAIRDALEQKTRFYRRGEAGMP
jgi:membrane-anchored protein YejM (alkaline phosphatase superfamily)